MDDISNPLSASSRILNTYMHKWKEQNKDETGNTVICSNCVYRSESNPTAAKINESCAIAPESNLVFENGRPVAGANACIDFADPGYLYAIASEKDALLGQRIYNGSLDVGAVEADWRERYGRDIYRRMEVRSVDSMVFERTDGSVRVPEGSTLNGVLLGQPGTAYEVELCVSVADGGSAKLTIGEEEHLLDAGTHAIKVSVGDAGLSVDIMAILGSADILRARTQTGFLLLYR